MLVVSIMSQLVLCGGMIPVTGRAGLSQLAWFLPGRWGFAAAASSINFPELISVPQIPSKTDTIWQYSAHILLLDLGMLIVLSLVYAGIIRWRIRLKH
jgi:hypothetical protein